MLKNNNSDNFYDSFIRSRYCLSNGSKKRLRKWTDMSDVFLIGSDLSVLIIVIVNADKKDVHIE